MKILALAFLTMGCTSIFPKVSKQSFEACWKLCENNHGMIAIQSNISLDYLGNYQKQGEQCICKNFKSFMINDGEENL